MSPFRGTSDVLGLMNKTGDVGVVETPLGYHVISIDDQTEAAKAVKEKEEMQEIILSDVQTQIYPDLEKSFLNLLHNSGYPEIKLEKKIDFKKLYNQRFN